MSAQNESAKDSLRQSFANLRKALPEGITEADADLLQDVALRLMDRGLPCPSVCRSVDDDPTISIKLRAPYALVVVVMDGDGEGYLFDSLTCRPRHIKADADEATRAAFVDEVVAAWAAAVTGEAKVNP